CANRPVLGFNYIDYW
nr:immunoglobulin heavy chain junction region [Macaca mulatta]MOW88043.1 immunoglobulin heavy chain junction region [Macaca mulatta]MOW88668.1 immunoglobulin heavy chain junction region [Macaca mulatta]MOW88862.1 immunoglobulin heavy chain junction region [Macaca mulatta]MOW89868.1 immunoglobulin heavy chain junction region [Macaca mulatta]